MQIVSIGDNLHDVSKPVYDKDNLHEVSRSVFWKKIKTTFQNVVCWNFTQQATVITLSIGTETSAYSVDPD